MRFAITPLRSPTAVSLFIGVLIALGVIGVRGLGALESWELTAYDLYLGLERSPAPDSRVAVIEITEKDIQRQGRWPLADDVLASLLETLAAHRPRAIGLDIYRDIEAPPGRERLNEVLTRYRQIVAVEKFGDDASMGVAPPDVLKGTEQTGVNDIVVDHDGIVRRGLLFLDDGVTVYYSFALRLALLYLQEEGVFPQPGEPDPQYLRLGKTTFRPFEANDGGYIDADARGYQTLLDFKSGILQSFTLTEALSGRIGRGEIKDKVVIIGATAESVADVFNVPPIARRETGGMIYGVHLHAGLVSQFLRSALKGDPPMSTFGERKEWLWILLWGLLGSALGLTVRPPLRFSLDAACGLLILALAGYYAFDYSVWIPVVPPAVAWLVSAALVTAYMSNLEKAQRAVLMGLFSKYVSHDVAEDIWKKRDLFLQGGRPRSQKLTATVLFTDLAGFTSISERFEPQALMSWLNEYMEAMTKVVIERGGVVSKYIGDAIMAVFGVPLPRVSEQEIRLDAVNAVECALAMDRELDRLNARWVERGLPTARMRVGIYTGPLVAGSLGGANRLEYTVIGDTVNTAARLESFGKDRVEPEFSESVCRILIGESTRELLEDRFPVTKVGAVHLKGKEEEVTVYLVASRQKRHGGAGENSAGP